MSNKIEELRNEIDKIDDLLLDCLAKRKSIVHEISKVKKENHLEVYDPARESMLKSRIRKIAGDKGINENFVNELYGLILKNSREEQK